MKITYDPDKRAQILAERGLDFEDAGHVFEGSTLTIEDDRFDYGEKRFQSLGELRSRIVMVVWTPRGSGRHIITMWKANEREKRKYQAQLE